MEEDIKRYSERQVSQIVRNRLKAANSRAEALEIDKATLQSKLDELRDDKQPEEKALSFTWLGGQSIGRRNKRKSKR